MIRRELAVVLASRLTWTVVGLSSLLVGHSFVLAVDVFTAGSRSVAGGSLMAREFDPLAGILRPTLGGVYLAASLLGPLIAARVVSIEKERRTFRVFALMSAAPTRMLTAKCLAALCGSGLILLGPIAALTTWRAIGGHVAAAETLVALTGHALYLGLVTSLAVACAAWTRTFAQAATLAVFVVLTSWAIDAAEGFAALAWLGRAESWSATTYLAPFERGTMSLRSVLWFVTITAGLFALALVGARFDLSAARRAALAVGVSIATVVAMAAARSVRNAWDLTESSRASFPPAVVHALRAIPETLSLEVWLDRDDSRRRQIESDALYRLRLARPDLNLTTPLDDRPTPSEGDRGDDYGRIVIRIGSRSVETFSTSRSELIARIFECAARPAPRLDASLYPGYPLVIEGRRRRAVGIVGYAVLPLGLLLLGWFVSRAPRRA